MKFRVATRLSVLAMLLALLYSLGLFFVQCMLTLRYPFGIDYGEGIVWQQALLMLTSHAYGEINSFPSIVFHYPPLYHLAVLSLTALTGWDMLVAGRIISISATFMIAIIIGLIINRSASVNISGKYRLLVSITSGLLVLSIPTILYWSQLMRVDMLALFLTLMGFYLGLKSFKKPVLVYGAALFFVAAVYTKQTMLAAPIAIFSLMLWLNPRLALAGISTCLISGFMFLGILNHITDGGFIHHIFLYNINSFKLERLYSLLGIISIHGLLIILAMLALRIGITENILPLRGLRNIERREFIIADPSRTTFFAILSYFIFTTPMLILFAKEGSAPNYMIEWLITCVMLIGNMLFSFIGLLDKHKGLENKSVNLDLKIRAILVPLLMTVYVSSFDYCLSKYPIIDNNPTQVAELTTLLNMVQQSHQPVISDEMVILLHGGQRVVWEPAIFAQLEVMGVWDSRTFVTKIRNNEFAMFITQGIRGDALFEERYTPNVADAMDAAYPIKKTFGEFTVHLPNN